jgi:hypothetical protein
VKLVESEASNAVKQMNRCIAEYCVQNNLHKNEIYQARRNIRKAFADKMADRPDNKTTLDMLAELDKDI